MSTYRYPGVKPFETADQGIFFGRDKDIADLCDLILLEKLVVLFGKSGYGKSSLLNAGVMPHFREAAADRNERYQPLSIRFGLYVDEKSTSPLEQVRRRLREEAEANPQGAFLAQGISLWYHFKSRQNREEGSHYLLLFDQFEEFFSYPAAQQVQFKEELAELLYKNLPQSVRDGLDQLPEDKQQFLLQKLDVKAVFAIRSDRLSDLDGLKDRLAAILYKRYELKGLNEKQAKQAILQPAALPVSAAAPFASPPFTYTEEALDKIIRELSSTAEGTARTGVEAFQLQILCQYIEGEVMAGRISQTDEGGRPEVGLADLPDIARVNEAYYRSQLEKLAPQAREAAREIIEEGLLYEDPLKGEARRLSVDADVLVHQFAAVGATHELLKKLEDTFLLRREMNTLGGYNYELSHDTLIAPVLKAKAERQAEKERRVAEQRTLEAEAEARSARRRSRRATLIAITGFLLAAVAVGASVFAIRALRNLQQRSNQTVTLLMSEADHEVLLLEYAAALENCVSAFSLGARQEEVTKRMQEIAFFYTETEQFGKADSVLQLLTDQPVEKDRQALLGVIKKLDPAHYDTLQARYYPVMIPIEGGSFKMGEDSIFHEVKLRSFKMAESETTVWQYNLFAVSTRREFQQPSWGPWGSYPVVIVTWYDAIAYSNWLSNRMELEPVYSGNIDSMHIQANWQADGFRLPTEAEWEFAARGGNLEKDKNYIYSGGNDLEELGWYRENTQSHPESVMQKKSNALGLYDLSGNVFEWCWDGWASYPTTFVVNPIGPENAYDRVVRGGSWNYYDDDCRVSLRIGDYADRRNYNVGFRLARY